MSEDPYAVPKGSRRGPEDGTYPGVIVDARSVGWQKNPWDGARRELCFVIELPTVDNGFGEPTVLYDGTRESWNERSNAFAYGEAALGHDAALKMGSLRELQGKCIMVSTVNGRPKTVQAWEKGREPIHARGTYAKPTGLLAWKIENAIPEEQARVLIEKKKKEKEAEEAEEAYHAESFAAPVKGADDIQPEDDVPF